MAAGFEAVQVFYCDLAGTAILFYDILLTYDREMTCIWKRKFSGVTVIFVCLRYITLVSQIATFANDVQPGIILPCKITNYLYYSTALLARISCAAFGSLRIWAIWGQHWPLLVVTLVLGLIPVVIDIYQVAIIVVYALALPAPFGGCGSDIALSSEIQTRLALAGRTFAIATDAVILIATWSKTWATRQGLRTMNVSIGGPRVSLSELLMRDGTIYFAALLCLNIMALILDTTPQVVFNPTSLFIDSFTAILLCRLILNLRSFNLTDGSTHHGNNIRQIASVKFADNIGASVSVHGPDEDYEQGPGRDMDVTLDDVAANPLVIGLEDDLYYPSGERESLTDRGVQSYLVGCGGGEDLEATQKEMLDFQTAA